MRRSWKSAREGAEGVAAAICRPVPGLRELAVSPWLTPWAIVFRSYELWFRAFPESPLFCRTRLATVPCEHRHGRGRVHRHVEGDRDQRQVELVLGVIDFRHEAVL